MNRLAGKNALITGASRGLGRQLAIDFASQGVAALALVARNGEALSQVRDSIDAIAPEVRVVCVTADLRREADVERAVATTLHEFQGRLDVLVNNASALGPAPMPFLLDYPLDDFRSVLETNLIAPFLLIKKLLPAMADEGGSIVNVTSDAGVVGYSGWGAYGISKFGIEGMSHTWAAELAGSKVRLNWVDPGSMDTDMHRAAEPDEDPTNWAKPADVTDVFIFLASDESHALHGRRFAAQEPGWGLEPAAAATVVEGAHP
jgi:NAD(P)-dependent dehydrogenase (short-subunit alcohol dehydrogenase family)